MRHKLFAVAALAVGLGLPAVAAADTLDQVTLSGGGYTISFTVPATATISEIPYNLFVNDSILATVNGVPNFAGSVNFFVAGPTPWSVGVSLYSAGSLPENGTLYGQIVDTYVSVPSTVPPPCPQCPIDYLAVVTLTPGTYNLTNPALNYQNSFQLTIAPVSTPTPTPEPGTLALLSTGLAGVFAMRSRFSKR